MLYSRSRRISSLHLTAACALALTLGAVPSSAFATAAPSALCREASLKNLFIEGSRDQFDGKDLCLIDPASLPGKFQETIRDAKEVHEKVAHTFGLRPEELFGAGVNLKIVAGVEGLNGTYKDELKQVELGTVINPRRWIDLPVYAHELGHWVADSKNPRVPGYFRGSRHTFLLDETLPDTVALAAYGVTGTLDGELPACMVPRIIDGKQTYNAPIDFFAARTGSRALHNCCQANQGRLTAAAEGVCTFVEGLIKKNPLPPLRPKVKFSAAAALEDLSKLDNHQIGVPVNSLLFALGEKLGRPVFREFLLASARARADSLLCRFEGDGKRGEGVPISVTPFVNQLEAFHASLKAAERTHFERLMKSFGIEAAIQIDEEEAGQSASAQGLDELFAALKANRSAKLNQRHRCFHGLQKYMSVEGAEPPAGCDVICQPR